jgi:hypothetical protein
MSDVIGLIVGCAFFALLVYGHANPKLTVTEAARKISGGIGIGAVVLLSLAATILGWWAVVALIHWAWRHS